MTDFISREAALDAIKIAELGQEYEAVETVPAADVAPWEFLERYADWFCAVVSMPEFIREAKAFYKDTYRAMDGGVIDESD